MRGRDPSEVPTGDASDPRLTIDTAEPGSAPEDTLTLLAGWAATAPAPASRGPAADRH